MTKQVVDCCPTCGSYQYRGSMRGAAWGEGLTQKEKQAVQTAYDTAPAEWKEFHCNDPWHERSAVEPSENKT
jgi:hypothetical protein